MSIPPQPAQLGPSRQARNARPPRCAAALVRHGLATHAAGRRRKGRYLLPVANPLVTRRTPLTHPRAPPLSQPNPPATAARLPRSARPCRGIPVARHASGRTTRNRPGQQTLSPQAACGPGTASRQNPRLSASDGRTGGIFPAGGRPRSLFCKPPNLGQLGVRQLGRFLVPVVVAYLEARGT